MCCCGVLSPVFRGGSVCLFSHFLSHVCLLSLIFCRSLSETILLSWFPSAAPFPSWGPRPFRLPRPVPTSSWGRVRGKGGAGLHTNLVSLDSRLLMMHLSCSKVTIFPSSHNWLMLRRLLWGPAPPSPRTQPPEEVGTERERQNGQGPHYGNGAAGGNHDNRIVSESDL